MFKRLDNYILEIYTIIVYVRENTKNYDIFCSYENP